MDLIFLPGYFGTTSANLLGGLARGGAFRGVEWKAGNHEGGSPQAEAEVLAWMLELTEGEVRKSHVQARLAQGPPVAIEIGSVGASAGRLLLDLKVTLLKEGSGTWADLEIALLGLACAGLAGEDQGGALLGENLHPTALLNPRGTVAEQIQRTLDFNDLSVRTLVLAPGTAASLGPLADFREERLGALTRLERRA